MTIEKFNHTIEHWIEELEHYSFIQLCTKPALASWSLGQMYRHLIDDGNFYIEQMKICVMNNDYTMEEATTGGKTMLRNNDFPNMEIEGSPNNAFIPQPASKEQLMNDLLNLKTEMNAMAAVISRSSFNGKTKHPGLGYFSASEWLQFADMHFRHHLRQKQRIDDFLRSGNS